MKRRSVWPVGWIPGRFFRKAANAEGFPGSIWRGSCWMWTETAAATIYSLPGAVPIWRGGLLRNERQGNFLLKSGILKICVPFVSFFVLYCRHQKK